MKNSDIHRGELLKKVIGRSDLSITQVSKRAGFNRSSYYNHIELHDLSDNILARYGKALNYDFSKDLPEMEVQGWVNDPEAGWSKGKGAEALVRELDELKRKYLVLLERYNSLLEERNRSGENQ